MPNLAPRPLLRIGEKERVVDLLVEHDLVREGVRGIVLREEGEKALRAVARALVQRIAAAALHDAAARDEHADGRVQSVGGVRPDIGVHVARHGGDPPFAEAREHFDLVAVFERKLELLVLRKGVHLLREERLRFLVVAAQKGKRLFNADGVFLTGDEVRAGRAAPPEMVVEAGFFGLFRDGDPAGADMIDARGDVHDVFARNAAHERTEILAVPQFHPPRDGYARKRLFGMHLDIGIGFIVL